MQLKKGSVVKVNEEKQAKKEAFVSEREKLLKRLYEDSLKQGIPIPEISLEYITLLIAKNPQILALNLGNTTNDTWKPNTKIEKYESLELAIIQAKQELKELGIKQGKNGQIINGVSIADYNETLKRLRREHFILRHPRTWEIIPTCVNDVRLPPIRRNHLNYCPRLPYHNFINQYLISGKFVIVKKPSETVKPYEVKDLEIKAIGEIKYRQTKTFKIDYGNGIKKPSKRPSRKGMWLEILKERDKAKMQLLNAWKLQQKHKRPRPKPRYRQISQTIITNVTTN